MLAFDSEKSEHFSSSTVHTNLLEWASETGL